MLKKLLFYLVLVKYSQTEWIQEMEDPSLYQGDMVLTPTQKDQARLGRFGFASAKSNKFWPKGQPIAYEIASSIDGNGLQAIKDAIADYHNYTCIRFKPRSNENVYIYFYRGAGCSSPVGYRGYRNDISLARNCWKKGIVMHEMAHSLGMFHEHSRPDRDKYIKILWNNILGDEKVNFQKEPATEINSLGTAYDLRSMMHYSSNAFGGGRRTIEVLDSSKQSWIGQRNGFSEIDKKQLNLMYCGSTPSSSPDTCDNKEQNCVYWAQAGYCGDLTEVDFMKKNCCKACKELKTNCSNNHPRCDEWAKRGECTNNSARKYMLKNCKLACKVC
ncbi:low choriolytic enzyme-like [Hydractinia symbiolongicarpus]|uniref:low choriolytic enzyme-like n=1 Tax=Hydractinia symbiolongicarpus TaxID=13093 RepID=UPI002551499B|nr:low choriolytic enzyme-like [Hydractinia symbiolongicarpus]